MAYSCKTRSGRCVKLNKDYVEKYVLKKSQRECIEKMQNILKNESRTKEDIELLYNHSEIVAKLEKHRATRDKSKLHKEICLDDSNILQEKIREAADILKNSKHVVVYTGAGLSTSASIPDYRGPNGLWTMRHKGIKIKPPDFSQCTPTYSHMALSKLLANNQVKHIVSQNCDGLHLRSGVDREKLSELHGNCFIEHCGSCFKEYVRLFDVTCNNSFRKHATGRYCHTCENVQLHDSIIHFGEKLKDGLPYNWQGARETLKQADCILCLGTSFKVLRQYKCLWPKKLKNLIIVNIQWTCKDTQATLKINSYCDQFMQLLVKQLHMNETKFEYNLANDPLLHMAIKLMSNEDKTNKNGITIVDGDRDNIHDDMSTTSWFNKSFKKKKNRKKGSFVSYTQTTACVVFYFIDFS